MIGFLKKIAKVVWIGEDSDSSGTLLVNEDGELLVGDDGVLLKIGG
ncbi:MAG TPA: hypothetical protein VIK69_09100 [Methylophilaceae bacterium]